MSIRKGLRLLSSIYHDSSLDCRTTRIAKFKSEFACKLNVSLAKFAFAPILLRKQNFYTAQSFPASLQGMWEINSPLSTLNNNYSSDWRAWSFG